MFVCKIWCTDERMWDKLFSTTAFEGNAVLLWYTPGQLIEGWTTTMWCGRPMDNSHRAIEEMMGYAERSGNSSTSINLNFRRSLYWLSQSDYWSSAGPNFYWLKVRGVKNDFAYRRCGEGKLYASNMLPRSKQKNVCNLPQYGKMQTV